MTQEFCEHLDEYGVAFGRAKASYENCLNLIEKIIENPGGRELRRTLEKALDEWVLETRNLRGLFKKMKKSGQVELIKNPDSDDNPSLNTTSAICGDCSFQVPKLEFPEFELKDESHPTFRGQTLPLPAGAGV